MSLFSKFIIKKKCYMFVSKHGYTDNTRYLFEYFVEKKQNCVWVTKKKEDYKLLTDKYKNNEYVIIVRRNSFRCAVKYLQSISLFVNHSFFDLSSYYPKCCIVVNLWHGPVMKKMGYDSEVDVKSLSLSKFSNPYQINDYVIATSEITQQYLMSCMRLSKRKILAFGQPKFDYLLKQPAADVENVFTYLYCPTYRDGNIEKAKKIYLSLIESFVSNNKIDRLILRLHPNERELIDVSGFERVIISNSSDYIEDFICSDVLITDYSSVGFDYISLGQPIVLYIPDFNDFIGKRGGFYFDYKSAYDGCKFIENAEQLNGIWDGMCKDSFPNKSSILYRINEPGACEKLYKYFVTNYDEK